MTLNYSLTVRLRDKLLHWKIISLEILSLIVVFYFSMMFISKMTETQRIINHYQMKSQTPNIVYQLSEIPFKEIPECKYTIHSKGEIYLDHNGVTHKVNIMGIDHEHSNFYQDDIFKDNDELNFFEKNHLIVPVNISRNLGIYKGDVVSINDRPFRILGTTSDHSVSNHIVIPLDLFFEISQEQEFDVFLTMVEEYSRAYESELHFQKREPLSAIYSAEVNSQKYFQLFIIGFSVIFIFIAFCNMFLIIQTRVKRERKFHLVLWLCGENNRNYFLSSIIDYMLLCLMSFFGSVGLYFILFYLL